MDKKQDEKEERGRSPWKSYVPEFVMKLQDHADPPEHLVKETYSKWVDTYEQDIFNYGYAGHIPCSQAFDSAALKFFKDKANSIRIIDVGAGTGLVGGLLKDLGYTNIDGIDCCDAMLQKARDKNIYENTFVSFIDEKKNEAIEDGMYDALISCGSISPTSIQPRAFDEMIRWVKKGGILCFSLRQDVIEKPGLVYSEKIQKLEAEKKWQLLSKELVHHRRSDDVLKRKAYICVYQVL